MFLTLPGSWIPVRASSAGLSAPSFLPSHPTRDGPPFAPRYKFRSDCDCGIFGRVGPTSGHREQYDNNTTLHARTTTAVRRYRARGPKVTGDESRADQPRSGLSPFTPTRGAKTPATESLHGRRTDGRGRPDPARPPGKRKSSAATVGDKTFLALDRYEESRQEKRHGKTKRDCF